ncbi:protein IMPACT isoform X2 [Acomys russatus]|uniref:protein IMPACT isoform X2 n=1 Tax=Acomys russatus TaxID=60746 RepID=UPI0021E1D028|nr:protein IMPACT isoform X2 [Acomys russatus]
MRGSRQRFRKARPPGTHDATGRDPEVDVSGGWTGSSVPEHHSLVRLLLCVLSFWIWTVGGFAAVPGSIMAEGDVGSDQKQVKAPEEEEDAGIDQRQNEEIEAMAAIYGEEWCVIDECAKIFCIRITDDIDEPKWTLCLQVMLPSEYPGTAPPIYQLNAPWLKGQERADLSNSLEEIYIQNIGECILYLWVEKIRDALIQKSQEPEPVPDVKKKPEKKKTESENNRSVKRQPGHQVKKAEVNKAEKVPEVEELPPVDHGVPITDRRSTFQAHVAPVACPEQVKLVLGKLYENKKIASATHNIYAYRIYCEDKQTFLQDFEDDGETAAGGRLLHLMEILNVKNVLVVVSRWYGGILLGPDRFKHINNCARNILVEKNFTPSPESSKNLGKKKVKKDKKRNDH